MPAELAEVVTEFVRERVLPMEQDALADGSADAELRARLRAAARECALFGPVSPIRYGGLALDHRGQVEVLLAAGASLLGPTALNCDFPDDATISLLDRVGTAEQVVVGDRGFLVCAARTDQDVTLFLVDSDNPGLRRLSTPGLVRFENCVVPDSAVLGAVGAGVDLLRSGQPASGVRQSARRLGLAIRAHELTARWQPTVDHGLVADNEIDIIAAGSLIRSTAALLDERSGADLDVAHTAAVTSTFVADAVARVLDRATQLDRGHDRSPVSFLARARGFRTYDGPAGLPRWAIADRVLHRLG
ncbi:MAG TPA: hypothetical protein VHW44_11505 [Pseudonocardiaceae bacterium]|nr:hypothetical protein [Pseudonocardiaceae bacterium]